MQETNCSAIGHISDKKLFATHTRRAVQVQLPIYISFDPPLPRQTLSYEINWYVGKAK